MKGSYQVIKTFQDLIKENNLEDTVQVKASFCLGHCTKGVAVKVDEQLIEDLTITNAEEKFKSHVMGRV